MIRKSLSLGVRVIIIFLLFCFVVAATFMFWITEAPRSLPLLNSYIESSFNSLGDNYKVSIEKTLVLWDNQEKTFDIRSMNMRLVTASDVVGFHFPETSVGFSLAKLLEGSFSPSQLTVLAPTIRVRVAEGPSLASDPKELYAQAWKKVSSLIQARKKISLETVGVRNAKLIIDAPSGSMLWRIKTANTKVIFHKNIPVLLLEGSIDFAGEVANFSVQSSISQDSSAIVEIAVENLPVHKVLKAASLSIKSMPLIEHNNTHLVLTASSSFSISPNGDLLHADFMIMDAYGKIYHPDYMQEPLYPHNIQMHGNISAHGEKLNITKASMQFSHKISTSFSLSCAAPFSDSPACQLDAEVLNFPVDTLGAFWPPHLASKARQWVTTRISGGIITKATGKFLFKPEYFVDKSFPEGAIAARVQFKDTQLDYLSSYPSIYNIGGVATFDSHQIDIISNQAMINESVIHYAHVQVPYIDVVGKSVVVEGKIVGNVGDVMAFIPMKSLVNKGFPLNLQSTSGHAQTDIKLHIPYKQVHLTVNDIDVAAKTTFRDINIKNIMPHIDVSGGQFVAVLESGKLTLDGSMLLNGNPSSFKSSVSLQSKEPLASQTTLHTVLLPKDQELLGITGGVLLKDGSIAATIQINHQKNTTTLIGDMNVANAVITWDKYNLNKPIGGDGLFHFVADMQGSNAISVPSFSYKAVDADIKGSAKLGKGFSILQFDLDKLISQQTNINLSYRIKPDNTTALTVEGSSLDLRNVNIRQLFQNPKESKRGDVTVNLGRILMKNDEVFTEFKGNMRCGKTGCSSASINANIGGEDKLILTLNPGQAHQHILSIYSDNAAVITRALNVSNNIRGGRLRVDATISDQHVIQGTLHVQNFVTINNPILSQILAVITLPGLGLVNLLKDNGIAFDKLTVPFVMSDGVIVLNNVKASGQVLNATSHGIINLNKSTLELSGVVTPTVYGINNLVSRIPLLGKIIMGGKNQGIIAANYSLSGPIDNVVLTVNPLSILTPGFLRRVFD